MSNAPASPTWIELYVVADAESVESVAELFRRYGHNEGVVIEEPYRQDEDGENFTIDPARPVIVRTYIPDDEQAPTRRLSLDEGLWHLRQLGVVGGLEERIVREDDWASSWKQHFPVLRIGHHFVVKPNWQDYEARQSDLVIHLDPGMAFGTGSHPTTEMCLLALEALDFNGATVLDAGAGSGILTIAASLLGAAHVDAIEIDPYAARALHNNLELNGVANRTCVIVGPIGSVVPEGSRYDLIVANIVARVLIEDAETIALSLEHSGRMVASGIIADREHEVIATYEAIGLSVVQRMTTGDWVMLVLGKGGP